MDTKKNSTKRNSMKYLAICVALMISATASGQSSTWVLPYENYRTSCLEDQSESENSGVFIVYPDGKKQIHRKENGSLWIFYITGGATKEVDANGVSYQAVPCIMESGAEVILQLWEQGSVSIVLTSECSMQFDPE